MLSKILNIQQFEFKLYQETHKADELLWRVTVKDCIFLLDSTMSGADHLDLKFDFGGFALAIAWVVAFAAFHDFFEIHDIASLLTLTLFILLLSRLLHTILKLIKLDKEYHMLKVP